MILFWNGRKISLDYSPIDGWSGSCDRLSMVRPPVIVHRSSRRLCYYGTGVEDEHGDGRMDEWKIMRRVGLHHDGLCGWHHHLKIQLSMERCIEPGKVYRWGLYAYYMHTAPSYICIYKHIYTYKRYLYIYMYRLYVLVCVRACVCCSLGLFAQRLKSCMEHTQRLLFRLSSDCIWSTMTFMSLQNSRLKANRSDGLESIFMVVAAAAAAAQLLKIFWMGGWAHNGHSIQWRKLGIYI